MTDTPEPTLDIEHEMAVYERGLVDGRSQAHRENDDMMTFYRNGGSFRWCWPKVTRVHPANPQPFVRLNRYPFNTIGVQITAFGRSWSLLWKATPRRAAGVQS